MTTGDDLGRIAAARRGYEQQVQREQLDGLRAITQATGKVHQATQELAEATDGVAGTLGLLDQSVRHVEDAVRSMEQAVTRSVQSLESSSITSLRRLTDEVQAMAEETDKAQKLSIKVAVGTALGGALLGAFSGAFAARWIGGNQPAPVPTSWVLCTAGGNVTGASAAGTPCPQGVAPKKARNGPSDSAGPRHPKPTVGPSPRRPRSRG